MYTKDKINRITLRLNDEQFEFVTHTAETLDVAPSEFLRMVINASLCQCKAQGTYPPKKGQEERRENEQTHNDNIV